MTTISKESCFLDTNLLVYAQDEDSPHFKKSADIIRKINEGKIKAIISNQILLEYAAVLTRYYQYPKKEVAGDLKILNSNHNIIKIYPTVRTTEIFLDLMTENPRLYVYDLYLIALMKTYGLNKIITEDKGFGEFKEIEVINPF